MYRIMEIAPIIAQITHGIQECYVSRSSWDNTADFSLVDHKRNAIISNFNGKERQILKGEKEKKKI